MEIDDLLYEYPPQRLAPDANIQLAIQKLAPLARVQPKIYGAWLAKAHVMAKQPEAAIKVCDDVLAIENPEVTITGRWLYFWKAAAFALQNEPSAMCAQLAMASAIDRKIRSAVIGQKEFFPFLDRDDLQAAVALPSKPTLDADILKLTELLSKEQTKLAAYELAKSLTSHRDQASVVAAALLALDSIISDIEEHGDANVEEFWGGGRYSLQNFVADQTHFKSRKLLLNWASSPLEDFLVWVRD